MPGSESSIEWGSSLFFINLYPPIPECRSPLIVFIFLYLSPISSIVCLPLFLCRPPIFFMYSLSSCCLTCSPCYYSSCLSDIIVSGYVASPSSSDPCYLLHDVSDVCSTSYGDQSSKISSRRYSCPSKRIRWRGRSGFGTGSSQSYE